MNVDLWQAIADPQHRVPVEIALDHGAVELAEADEVRARTEGVIAFRPPAA